MPNSLKDEIALQQQDSHTYTLKYDRSWQMGTIILGGGVVAAIAAVAQMHFNTTLASQGQPDIHTLHYEFFRPCTVGEATVKVTDLRVGKASCCSQFTLYQAGGNAKTIALITSTNFGVSFGPSANESAAISPTSGPMPDFRLIDAKQPDPNWIPSKTITDLLPLLSKMTYLYPAEGLRTPGVIDFWWAFDEPEEFDIVHLALLSDVCPSPSDTLLGTGAVWDASRLHGKKKALADANPGHPVILSPTTKEASQAAFWNTTLTIDIQFKRRLTSDDRWTFTRATTRSLNHGRMDLTCDVFDKDLRPLSLVRQAMVAVDPGRRFKKGTEKVEERKGSKL